MIPLKGIGLSLIASVAISTDSPPSPSTSSPSSPCTITRAHITPLPDKAGRLKDFLSSGYERITPVFCPIQREDLAEFTKQLSSGTVEADRWCGQSATLSPPSQISYLVCRRNPRVCFTISLGWS